MNVRLEDQEHPLAGRWHLLGADESDGSVPAHRVDLILRHGEAGLSGAVQSRVGNLEFPLRVVTFDGTELRLQMAQMPNAALVDDPPFLVMRPVADHFEGRWDMPGTEHIRLKLVRAPL
jgi:hypothetical protein